MRAPVRGLHITRATSDDVIEASTIIASAFAALKATQWLVPEANARVGVLAEVFSLVVGHALDHGHVYLTRPTVGGAPANPAPSGAGVGAAVWLDRRRPLPPPPDYARRLQQAAGKHAPRFRRLDDLFDEHHPTGPHHHLAFLAVVPEHQGAGIGAELLRHHHAVLETSGTAAYLEAANSRSRRLYSAHGYQPLGEPFAVTNGATFIPMWRSATCGGA